ncbi:MAG: hypothetical protein DCC52_15480 [Chloroflexi bacterium]|nr:MAG: hypothetical protein DCC52_15480 [Chloroflexota bacterium]
MVRFTAALYAGWAKKGLIHCHSRKWDLYALILNGTLDAVNDGIENLFFLSAHPAYLFGVNLRRVGKRGTVWKTIR